MKKLILLLRWLGVLPLSILAAWLVWIITNAAFKAVNFFFGIDPEGFLSLLYLNTLTHAMMGGVLVFTAAKVAPKFKGQSAFVVAGLAVLAGLVGIVGAAMLIQNPNKALSLNYWSICGFVFEIVGIAFALLCIRQTNTNCA